MVLNPAAAGPARRSSLAVDQAVTALRAGDAADAERILRTHLITSPNDADALAKLAQIVGLQGRSRESVLLLRQVVRIAPHAHEERLELARLLHQQGDPFAALDQVELLPTSLRSTFAVQTFEAALLGLLGRHDPEIAIYERLVTQHPDHAVLWVNLGDALKYAGRGKEAAQAIRTAVKLRPALGEGWWSLANLKTARFDGRDIAAIRKALRGNVDPQDALHMHFALGKALEDREVYAQSFRHYETGNAIRASFLPREQMYVTGRVDDMISLFDQKLLARCGDVGDPSEDPIFVVGLQRSGSTLIEQILASHPLIEGTSELPVMQQLWFETIGAAQARRRSVRQHLLEMGSEEFADIGAAYLERTRRFRHTAKPLFVDKLPANWLQTGFIRLVLPNAKIIDARRHPMACGFSNFKQHYATGVTFSYSQDAIGRFYFDYLRLMRHFEALQPGAVHLAINEQLIEDTEAEVRKLLEFVGVPFDDACLAPHSTRRSVNTASAEQVRRPINRDGMDHWRNYEQWLTPLKEALGPALHDWR